MSGAIGDAVDVPYHPLSGKMRTVSAQMLLRLGGPTHKPSSRLKTLC